jgi:hypothetical protein
LSYHTSTTQYVKWEFFMRWLILGVMPIIMIFSSCGSATTMKANIPADGSPSGTSTLQPSAVIPPFPIIEGHTPDAAAMQACGTAYTKGTQFQNFLVDTVFTANFGYDIYKKLSDNLPLKPFQLTYGPSSDPKNPFKDSYEAGPPLQIAPDSSVRLAFDICNFTTVSHKITSIFVRLDAFKPYNQTMNVWESTCSPDTYFTRPNHVDDSTGCGGAIVAINRGVAAFGASDPQSATGTYAKTIPAQGDPTFPVIIAPVGQSTDPDAQLSTAIQVKGFATPGLYTLSIGIVDESDKLMMLPTSFSYYSVPQARRWSGNPCHSSDMQAQIPTTVTNPPTYYICPGNLVTNNNL